MSTIELFRPLRRSRRRDGQGDATGVTVVRSGPDTQRMRPVYPPPDIRDGADHLLVYLGIMGPQDGVDSVLDVMDELVHRRGRHRLRAALLGFGDCLSDLREQAHRLHLDDHVVFTGRVGPDAIADYLSAADVGLCPDLKTPLNDLSTMNKTMEYMAYCLPSVSFDLAETRVSAGDTALFVRSGDLIGFADAIERLLDDAELRVSLGTEARARVVAHLDWRQQAVAYVGAFERLLDVDVDVDLDSVVESVPLASVAAGERTLVPLDDISELRRFVRTRSAKLDPAMSVST